LRGSKAPTANEILISVSQRIAPSGVGLEVRELAATERHDSRLDLEEALDLLRIVLGRREHQRSGASQRKEGDPLDQTLGGRPEVRMRQR